MKVAATRILNALMKNKAPIIILEGSMRSTKTFSLIQWAIALGHSGKKTPLVIRFYRRHSVTARKTLVKDFKKIMKTQFLHLWNEDAYNKTEGIFTCPDGSEICFSGCDDIEDLHGQTQDIAILNEVMSIGYNSYEQIAPRTRLFVAMDFNPSVTQHWVFDKILDKMPKHKFMYLHSTYLDNPFLTPEQIYHIEKWEPTEENIKAKTNDKWRWEVYGLGLRSKREGSILLHWDLCEEYPDKMSCQKFGYGLDFGFSEDPTVLVECALFQNQIYLKQRIYEKGLTTLQNPNDPSIPSIQKRLEEAKISKTDLIIADSSRPDNIASLRGIGYNIIPCKKGPGSVEAGLDLINTFSTHIHIDSIELQGEAENYCWKVNPLTEKTLNVPEDKDNHGIDGFRYWVTHHFSKMQLEKPQHKPLAFVSEFRYVG